jgi:phosphoribosyl 1,2-cyclic phosphate phosphodiesterase
LLCILKYWGTSGSGGWPSLFCNGHASQRALEAGGKNIRSRSSLLIDQVLKIDLPPDSFHQAVTFGFNFSDLKYLFITRSSYNNFAAGELENLTSFLAHRKNLDFVQIFGNNETIAKIKQMEGILHATFHEIQPDQMINIGSFDVYPLKAMNNGDLYPLNYIVRKNRKSVLYATDTGVYDEKTWKNLKGL